MCQSGDFDVAGITSRALVNYQDTNTGGYLSLQSSAAQNYLVKVQTDIAPGWTLTAFANFNGLFQQLEDNAGATAAQLIAYRQGFALQKTNPNAGTYAPYNHVHKKTDMDYLRLQGDLGNGIKIDNQAYTYAYVNKTLSTTSVMQTAADIAAGITEGNGTIVNGVKFPNNVPGYTKQNAYRNWGDIFRMSDDFDFGWLTGQVRAGVWWETSRSQRARSDFDATQCFSSIVGCDPWHTSFYADSRLFNSTSKPSTVVATPTSRPFGNGFFEYEDDAEHHQAYGDVAEDLARLGRAAAVTLRLGLTAEDDRGDAEQTAAEDAEDAADQRPSALVAVRSRGGTAVGRSAVQRLRRRRCVVAHGRSLLSTATTR